MTKGKRKAKKLKNRGLDIFSPLQNFAPEMYQWYLVAQQWIDLPSYVTPLLLLAKSLLLSLVSTWKQFPTVQNCQPPVSKTNIFVILVGLHMALLSNPAISLYMLSSVLFPYGHSPVWKDSTCFCALLDVIWCLGWCALPTFPSGHAMCCWAEVAELPDR